MAFSGLWPAIVLAGCSTEPTTSGDPATALPLPNFATASNSWTTQAPMPTARSHLAVGVVSNAAGQTILYAMGGIKPGFFALRRVEAYNSATSTWTRKASLPEARSIMNGAGVIGGKLYVSGGGDSNRTVRKTLYVYTPGTDSWTKKAALPIASALGVTGIIGDKLYVLTGGSADCAGCATTYTRRLYRYDPGSNTWSRLADCPEPHLGGAAGVIDGKLYVAGGFTATASSKRLHVYDPVANAWSTKASMSTARNDVAGAVLAKKFYVIGGISTSIVGTVEAYDPTTNTWTTRASMPTPRAYLGVGKVKNSGGGCVKSVKEGSSELKLAQVSLSVSHPRRRPIAKYGHRNRAVRVFAEAGYVRVMWREHGMRRYQSWPDTKECRREAKAYAQVLSDNLGMPRETPSLTLRQLWTRYREAAFPHCAPRADDFMKRGIPDGSCSWGPVLSPMI